MCILLTETLFSSAYDPFNFDVDPDPIIFILKLDEPFRNEDIFIISLFSKVHLGFMSKKDFFCSFWLIFYPLDPDPWIRIFLRIQIWIQAAKIQILNTAFSPLVYSSSFPPMRSFNTPVECRAH